MKMNSVDTIVLGCTHYPLVHNVIKKIMGENGFYKGSDPVDYAATAPGLYVGEGKDLPF